MESFEEVIDEFDDGLDDTRNIESIMDFDIFDVISESDDKIRDHLINPATKSSDNTSIANISENNILESTIPKNVHDKSNDEINNRANNFEYLPEQMNAENGNSNGDLKEEESLCTQCKADTELSEFNCSGKDLFVEAETDLLEDEIRISGSKNVSNIMNRVIEVLGSLENTTDCHLSSSVLFTPSDRHLRKRSSSQEISPKNLFECVPDGENNKIGSTEFEKKQFPRNRYLPKFDRNCTINLIQTQETWFSNLNKSNSEGNMVAIKRKRVDNIYERIEPVIISCGLSMQTDGNVQRTLNASRAQQCVELTKFESSNDDKFEKKYISDEETTTKNAPIDISMSSQVVSAGDKLEEIRSVGNRFVTNDEKLNDDEILNSGTSCALRNEITASSGYNNTEIVDTENKIGSIEIPSIVEEVCYMNLEERSVDVVPETSLINESKEIQSLKDVTSVNLTEDLAKNFNLMQEEESYRKDIDPIDTSDLFLELSVESELNQIEKEGTTIYKEETNKRVDKIIDIGSFITSEENFSKANAETRIEPVDLAVAQRSSFRIKDCEKTDIGVEDLGSTNAPTNLNDQFRSDKIIENNYERKDEKVGLENIGSNNYISDPVISNIASTNNPKISDENIQCPADDFSSPLLSESQLEKIEREAFMTAKECETANKTKLASLANQEDIFYKPDNVNSSIPEQHYDTLSIPNWVTNPTPEPDYNKMRHTDRMRRKCIRKMLDEILRLSTIITKIGKIINEKPRKDNFQLESQSGLQIPHSHPASCVKKNLQIGPAESETFAKVNVNVDCSDNGAKKSRKSDVFYVPEVSESSYDSPPVFTKVLNPQPANFGASTANVEMLNAKLHRSLPLKLKEKNEFYVPPTIGTSKYDPPVIFDDPSTVKYGTGTAFSSHNTKFADHGEDDFPYQSTSNIFNSVNNKSSNFGSHTSVGRRIWYNDEEKENEIRKKRFETTDISKNNTTFENSNVPVTREENRNIIRSIGKIKDNAKPVINIFYSPEEPSSSSSVSNNTSIKNNFIQLLCTKNIPDVSSHDNFTTQSSSCHIGPNKSRRQNLGSNFTSLQARYADDNGLFFNGNVE